MGHNANNIISAPVDLIGDIAYVLGSSVSDRGDLGRMIANGNINKWAKYKPVKSVDFLTGKTLAPSSTWWQGSNGQCGLAFDVFTELGSPSTVNSFFNKLLAGSLSWGYDRPTGGTWKYRALDFDGYNPSAENPLPEQLSYSLIVINQDGSIDINYDFVITTEQDSLQLSDIKANGEIQNTLSDYYFGVLVYYPTSGVYRYGAQTTVGSLISGSGSFTVNIDGMSGWAGRTVRIVPFLSSVAIDDSNPPSSGKFLSLNLPYAEVTITSSVVNVYFNVAQWNSAGTEVNYDIDIENLSGASKSGTMVISLYKDSATGTLVNSKSVSYNIANGSTANFSGTITGTNDGQSAYFLKVFSANTFDDHIQVEDAEGPTPE